MPIEPWFLRYPFSGVQSRVTLPVPDDAHAPKTWSVIGYTDAFGQELYAPLADFEGAGVQIGDPVFIHTACPHIQLADTVQGVYVDFIDLLNTVWTEEHNCVVVKIGVGAQHTLQSLADIVAKRAALEYVLRFRKLWTSGGLSLFNRDETGDVYCVAPP